MKHLKALSAVAVAIIGALAISISASAGSAADPNICDADEFWEGECRSTDDWIAGWYLHPDNDPGDGAAVKVAYSNYANVIVHMPHSMCIDWRTANCDGTIPPEPPKRKKRSDRSSRYAKSVGECIKLANRRSNIHSYCQSLYNYDSSLSSGSAGYNAKLANDRAAFISGLKSLTDCALAAHNISTNCAAYMAGNLDDAQAARMRADIVTVKSWTCTTHHNRTPPSIPSSPS